MERSSDPVEAIEETAQDAAEAIEEVTETVTTSVDESTGEIASGTSGELQDRVTSAEVAIQELRSRVETLPGMAEVQEATAELEDTVTETVEEPVHVTVETAADVIPQKKFFAKWWPKWL